MLIYRLDPGSGNLVSFVQFLFIAVEGFIFTSKCGTKPLRIGYTSYLVLVAMFFVVHVCNNVAFDFNIPMPLHMIIRSVSSITIIMANEIDFHNFHWFFMRISIVCRAHWSPTWWWALLFCESVIKSPNICRWLWLQSVSSFAQLSLAAIL